MTALQHAVMRSLSVRHTDRQRFSHLYVTQDLRSPVNSPQMMILPW
jgi:hypothetical protein